MDKGMRVYGESLDELKNAGGVTNANHLVEKWIGVYTYLNVMPLDYHVDNGLTNVLENIEDVVIANLKGVNPKAQEELDAATLDARSKISEYKSNLPDDYSMKNVDKLVKLYEQEKRENNKPFYMDTHQVEIVKLRKQFRRDKFRKLVELARQMFIANNKEVYK